jgi:hypothetical protein
MKKLAPHVQAAIAAGLQRKPAPAAGPAPAAHLRTALADHRPAAPRAARPPGRHGAIQRMEQDFSALDAYLEAQGFDDLDDDDRKVSTKEDATYGGARLVGNSSDLANARYGRTIKADTFQNWKKNREAQHLIPASLCKHYPGLDGIIDSAENGMMLPAVYSNKNDKVTHRKPNYRDHPAYTKNVKALIDAVLQTGLNKNQATYKAVMRAVRPVNKLAAKYQYLDDIPYQEFKDSWNSQQPKNQI